MRWKVTLYLEDRNTNRRTCMTHVQGLDTLPALVAFANTFGDRVQALSSAHLVLGTLSTKVKPTVVTTAQPESNVGRKLLLLCTEKDQFGSLEIPSPGALPFERTGDYAGVRLRKADLPPTHPIAQGIAALRTTVRPDGLPFPVADWVLALISD